MSSWAERCRGLFLLVVDLGATVSAMAVTIWAPELSLGSQILLLAEKARRRRNGRGWLVV